MEDDVSRKLVISVIVILVIILATNNFMDLTGQPVKPLQKAVTKCYDSDGGNGRSDLLTQSYNGGRASYGSTTLNDRCVSYGEGSRTLIETYCGTSTWATSETVGCNNGCMKTYYGDTCKQVVQTTSKKVAKKR